MNKQIEPLKRFASLSAEAAPTKEKKAAIFFVDSNFKPLSVSRQNIGKSEEFVSYKNHIEFLPRAGDSILIGDAEKYRVKEILHSLPSVRSDVQKVYVVLE